MTALADAIIIITVAAAAAAMHFAFWRSLQLFGSVQFRHSAEKLPLISYLFTFFSSSLAFPCCCPPPPADKNQSDNRMDGWMEAQSIIIITITCITVHAAFRLLHY